VTVSTTTFYAPTTTFPQTDFSNHTNEGADGCNETWCVCVCACGQREMQIVDEKIALKSKHKILVKRLGLEVVLLLLLLWYVVLVDRRDIDTREERRCRATVKFWEITPSFVWGGLFFWIWRYSTSKSSNWILLIHIYPRMFL
jgi:hypothetical protein